MVGVLTGRTFGRDILRRSLDQVRQESFIPPGPPPRYKSNRLTPKLPFVEATDALTSPILPPNYSWLHPHQAGSHPRVRHANEGGESYANSRAVT